jgi:hypothetical protein
MLTREFSLTVVFKYSTIIDIGAFRLVLVLKQFIVIFDNNNLRVSEVFIGNTYRRFRSAKMFDTIRIY